MGEHNESTRILNAVIGLLLFCIVVACVSILIGFAHQREEFFVDTMHEATNSSRVQRLTELEMQSEPVLCTAVASILAEFGPEELAYVIISADGTSTVYHNDQLHVILSGASTEISSSAPVEEAVKHILKYSEHYCSVVVETDDEDFTHVEVVVI